MGEYGPEITPDLDAFRAVILFQWKKDTSVEEEEGKLIATRFIISYLKRKRKYF